MQRILRKTCRRRRGTTAVETAFALPILFLLVFGLIEFSLVFRLRSAAQLATVYAARRARVAGQDATSIEQHMQQVLERQGISSYDITITPGAFTEETEEVTIGVNVPVSAVNGCYLTERFADRSLTTAITVKRQ